MSLPTIDKLRNISMEGNVLYALRAAERVSPLLYSWSNYGNNSNMLDTGMQLSRQYINVEGYDPGITLQNAQNLLNLSIIMGFQGEEIRNLLGCVSAVERTVWATSAAICAEYLCSALERDGQQAARQAEGQAWSALMQFVGSRTLSGNESEAELVQRDASQNVMDSFAEQSRRFQDRINGYRFRVHDFAFQAVDAANTAYLNYLDSLHTTYSQDECSLMYLECTQTYELLSQAAPADEDNDVNMDDFPVWNNEAPAWWRPHPPEAEATG